MTYTFLQNYWWVLIALLGGLLTALMFVQGANVLLGSRKLDTNHKRMILNSTGRKWELTFTTLVTFGGAFFASFPLFYSTSFGGAYWVWVLLLVTFVFQAVSYEFQHKKGNLIGAKGFRIALMVNGILAPFLVGTAVGTFFTGSPFTVDKAAIANPGSPVISTWGICRPCRRNSPTCRPRSSSASMRRPRWTGPRSGASLPSIRNSAWPHTGST